jgi:hypothetical protein
MIPLVLTFGTLSTFQAQSASTVFIPTNAVWKYLDDGSNQGTAWRLPDFADTSWRSGCAQLGYGDGDECTLVSYGPDPLNKHITTYFRHQFVATNVSQYLAVSLQLIRDDGAVVYLNGQEILRSNMPADGAILFDTFAARVATLDEGSYLPAVVCSASLIEGTNTIAVEVHQVSLSSSDISFDLAVEGLTAFTPDVRITLPEEGSRVSAGANVSILASATQPCGTISSMEVYEGEALLGQTIGASLQITWTNPPLGSHTIYAVAINEFGTRGTSGPVNIRVLVSGNTALVPAHSNWKYLDNGSDQGAAWTSLAFDDSSWSNGMAELGYGDADEGRPEATIVSYGPDADNKYITTYFRHAFTVTNAELLPNLALRVLRDDGVVVYLNGLEVLRNNLPATGPITYTTPASASVGGNDETNWVQTCISPVALVKGANVIAAEIHQAFPQSSDISFDLELVTAAAAVPKLFISISADVVSICWPRWAECYVLQSADRASATANWQAVNAVVLQNADLNCVALPISGSAAFYRLKLH